MIATSIGYMQVRRMSGMKYFPADEIAVLELVEAACTARTEEICRSVIGDIVQGQQECPKPFDIIAATRAANVRWLDEQAKSENPQKEPCSHCSDTGWIHVSFLATRDKEFKVTIKRLNAYQESTSREWLTANQWIIDSCEPCPCRTRVEEPAE